MTSSSVLCVVPARSGSKRVPDKNLQVVGGLSLLARAVRRARAAYPDVVVSTDSERYAEEARREGARVPELRPPALSGDEASMDEVARHAVLTWGSGQEYVVIVQPSSPFTRPEHITALVGLLSRLPEAAVAVTAVRARAVTGFVMAEEPSGLWRNAIPEFSQSRSQDVPALAIPTGGAVATRVQRLLDGGSLGDQPLAVTFVDDIAGIDIDDVADLEEARRQALRLQSE